MPKGVYTSAELIDSIIVDLNNIPKELMCGQYINACSVISQMARKLINLKKGVTDDIDNKNRIIEDLKNQLRNAGVECTDMTAEEFVDEYNKGGVIRGSN